MASIEPGSPIVTDAGPLIHLDELASLDLLADFHQILVPEPVWAEVLRHRPSALEGDQCRLERCPVKVLLNLQLEARDLRSRFLVVNLPTPGFGR